ncbi:MAG: hypothetical protein IJI51_03545 [Lachnospiraceae bacterium]|nr:hypothetical protein [Lachnospiraceae bacterium]
MEALQKNDVVKARFYGFFGTVKVIRNYFPLPYLTVKHLDDPNGQLGRCHRIGDIRIVPYRNMTIV